jgi:hypothetical protein
VKIALVNRASNAHTVQIGDVTLYFSYASCIAFSSPGTDLFNPAHRKHSATTSKHATALYCSRFPDARDEANFHDLLKDALSRV